MAISLSSSPCRCLNAPFGAGCILTRFTRSRRSRLLRSNAPSGASDISDFRQAYGALRDHGKYYAGSLVGEKQSSDQQLQGQSIRLVGQPPTTATTVTITLLEAPSPKPAQASDTTAITRVLADVALIDRGRRADTRRSHGHRRRVLQRLLRRARCVRPSDVTFDGRSRRSPRDLPNAAPSYGYAILLSACVGALHAAGLEPSLGIAHAPTDKRPSLALDIMEQFRPLLVDQTVMALLRTRKLRPKHGVVEVEGGGVWLGSDGKKILVDAYEAACRRSVTGALPGYSGSWRRHIAHSAQMLARAIAEPDYQWSGVAWR